MDMKKSQAMSFDIEKEKEELAKLVEEHEKLEEELEILKGEVDATKNYLNDENEKGGVTLSMIYCVIKAKHIYRLKMEMYKAVGDYLSSMSEASKLI